MSQEKMAATFKPGAADTLILTKQQMRAEIAEQRAEIDLLRAQVE